jgi:hypothetical protein
MERLLRVGAFFPGFRRVTAARKVDPAAVKSERLPYQIEKTKTDRASSTSKIKKASILEA